MWRIKGSFCFHSHAWSISGTLVYQLFLNFLSLSRSFLQCIFIWLDCWCDRNSESFSLLCRFCGFFFSFNFWTSYVGKISTDFYHYVRLLLANILLIFALWVNHSEFFGYCSCIVNVFYINFLRITSCVHSSCGSLVFDFPWQLNQVSQNLSSMFNFKSHLDSASCIS